MYQSFTETKYFTLAKEGWRDLESALCLWHLYKNLPPVSYFEIGCHNGHSASIFVEAQPTSLITLLDPQEQDLLYQSMWRLWPKHPVKHIRKLSWQLKLEEIPSNLGVVLIDGDDKIPTCEMDCRFILPHMNHNALIVLDDFSSNDYTKPNRFLDEHGFKPKYRGAWTEIWTRGQIPEVDQYIIKDAEKLKIKITEIKYPCTQHIIKQLGTWTGLERK